jgi:hypothetical protein
MFMTDQSLRISHSHPVHGTFWNGETHDAIFAQAKEQEPCFHFRKIRTERQKYPFRC